MARGGKRDGSGRKPMTGVVIANIRVSPDMWAMVPKPKAEYVRKALSEKLERDLEEK